MTLYIKNMVCDRCKMVVRQEIEKLGLHAEKVVLGEVTLSEEALTPGQQNQLDAALMANGFERIDDRKARLIESIKNRVIQKVHHTDRIDRKFNWSDVLSE